MYAGALPHVRYLKVSEGCDHGCAFCAIPLMRGRHRSFALADVIREVRRILVEHAAPAFREALQLLHKGEKAVLWVPPSDSTQETLVYEVELVDVVPPPVVTDREPAAARAPVERAVR